MTQIERANASLSASLLSDFVKADLRAGNPISDSRIEALCRAVDTLVPLALGHAELPVDRNLRLLPTAYQEMLEG